MKPPGPPNSAPQTVGGAFSTPQKTLPLSTSFGPAQSRSSAEETAVTSGGEELTSETSSAHHSSPSATPLPLFLGHHPLGTYVLLPDGRTPVPIPNRPSGPGTVPQVATVLERPLMHAPIPQCQPPRPLQPHPPRLPSAKTGGDNTHFNPQLPQQDPAHPEEVWPNAAEENHPNQPPPGDHQASPPSHLPPRYIFPFGIPAPSEQGIPLMRPTHLSAIPPGGHTHPGVPVSVQHMFPFFFAPHRPPALPAHLQPHRLEVETDTKEVQTSPHPSPIAQVDQAVEAQPSTATVGVQCERATVRDGCSNTEPVGVSQPLFFSDDVKPPSVSAQAYLLSGDVHGQIRVLTEYAEQVKGVC